MSGNLGYALAGLGQGFGQLHEYRNEQKFKKAGAKREEGQLEIARGAEARAGAGQRLQAAQTMLADATAEMQRPDWDARPDGERAVVEARAEKARSAIQQAGGMFTPVPADAAMDTPYGQGGGAGEQPPNTPPVGGLGQFHGGLNAPLINTKLTPQTATQPFDTGQSQPGAQQSTSQPDPALLQQIASLGIPALGGIHAPEINPQQVGSLMQEASPGFQMPHAPPSPGPLAGPSATAAQTPSASPRQQQPGAQQSAAPQDFTSHFMTMVQPMFEHSLPVIQRYYAHGNFAEGNKAIEGILHLVQMQAQTYAQQLANKAQELGLPYIGPEAQAKIAAELGQAAQSRAMAAIGIPGQAYHDIVTGKAAVTTANAKDTLGPLNLQLKVAELANQVNATTGTIQHNQLTADESRRHDLATEGHDVATENLGVAGLRQHGEIAGAQLGQHQQEAEIGPLQHMLTSILAPRDVTGMVRPQKDAVQKYGQMLHQYKQKYGYEPDPGSVVPKGIDPGVWKQVIDPNFQFDKAVSPFLGKKDARTKAYLVQLKQAAGAWNQVRSQYGQ